MSIHSPRLYRTGVGSEQDLLCNVESVLHIPCWVVLRQIHPLKVVIVLLHFKAVHDLIAHPDENIFDFLTSLTKNMTVPYRNLTAWQSHIQGFLSQFQSY